MLLIPAVCDRTHEVDCYLMLHALFQLYEVSIKYFIKRWLKKRKDSFCKKIQELHRGLLYRIMKRSSQK